MVTKLELEYHGGAFAGWARQPRQRTVQGEIERALAVVLGEDVALTVAGRTDRGVHAWGQVASYAHEAVDPGTLNGLLAPDVAVLASLPADEGFDARADARSRTYCYRVLNRRTRSVWLADRAMWVPRALDTEALHACAAALAGKHDFTAFTPSDTRYRWFGRTVGAAEWRQDGPLLEFWITADAFLRHMNRVLVGTMLQVALGNRTVASFEELLTGRPRSEAAATAPPHGLALAGVAYEEPGAGAS
ncbi:MAG TPA: tRNA pseudouridine(38-40) synthase TruA [Solirubrobacteraceae bacterium]|nr:tRNA pseudouridine(38-40) synthase TruA [Solirubrobacteraceae bacterium]